jgi:hypothetical protein
MIVTYLKIDGGRQICGRFFLSLREEERFLFLATVS